jgi:uncharacterized membrane protein YfcA
MVLAVLSAYTVFGMTGFGSAIVAVPMLVQFKPLAFAVPLILLLDFVATLTVGGKNWRKVDRLELLRLSPWMLLGVVLGVAALSALEPRSLLLGLGLFICANAVWSLRTAAAATAPVGAMWSAPAGLVGGMFGAAFGTGGPIYTLYLVRRVLEMDAFRATIAVVVLVSAVLRLAVFGVAGLLADLALLQTAIVLAPVCFAGVLLGSGLRPRFEPQTLRRLILQLLLVGGLAVLGRAMQT